MASDADAASAGGYFGQLGRAFTQVWHESAAVRVMQNASTCVCVACGQRILRAAAWSCAECEQPSCRTCVQTVYGYNPLGLSTIAAPGPQTRVCGGCRPAVLLRLRTANIDARLSRLETFFEGRLEPYRYSAETKVDQSLRLGEQGLSLAKRIAGFLPVASEAVAAISAGYYIVRYGPLVLAGDDVVLVLQLLVTLASKLDTPSLLRSTPTELFGGLYYMMGEVAGERGRAPELERLEHVSRGGIVPAPDTKLLMRLRRLVRLLLATSRDRTPTDAQRLLRQVLPGSALVLAELSANKDMPSYLLACTAADKQAYFILPGTSHLGDVVTDMTAEEAALQGGLAHKGMKDAASYLLDEVSPVLVRLYTRGYNVIIVGHSLGAGIGALLTLMLRSQISNLLCYGFGTPACVDDRLLGPLVECMVSVVNRDDVVPRLTVHSVQALADAALCPGQVAKTKAWMAEDWRAVKDIERIIALKRREDPAAIRASSSRCASTGDASMDEQKVQLLIEAGVSRERALRALSAESGDITSALLRATDDEVESLASCSSTAIGGTGVTGAPAGPAPDSSSYVEGSSERLWGELRKWSSTAGEQVSSHLQKISILGVSGTNAPIAAVRQQDSTRLLVPGQVIHLFRQNGLARAALSHSTHESLTRISLCQNMLEDHKVSAYHDALAQALASEESAPRWESFEERPVCACCGADFNWAYVLASQPQKMLARKNCFRCGRVVCDGCSTNRRAHPEVGLCELVRTCDGCFFKHIPE